MAPIPMIPALLLLAIGQIAWTADLYYGDGCDKIRAVCRMENYTAFGEIIFTQEKGATQVSVVGQISGLNSGEHGFHVHTYGNLSDSCNGAGPHYNPRMMNHGAPTDAVRHVGDLGNIVAGYNGVAGINVYDYQLRLCGPYSILGRGLVVHLLRDDLGRGQNEESLKTGNSGARIGCCVIGVAPNE